MTILRPFQQDVKSKVLQLWLSGAQNVLAVMPTGAGKTVLFSNILSENEGHSFVIAHRSEILSQISMALARNGVRHNITAPNEVCHTCTRLHIGELGRNYFDRNSRVNVASVDTLLRKDNIFPNVNMVVHDEAHHVLKKNKWGKVHSKFPNARCLGVTATPCRADGYGLGKHADGIFDQMVVGPDMRWLIEEGWLTDYRIFAPPSDLDLRNVPVSASGEFSPIPLSNAVHKSHIVGDIVSHYSKLALGKLGVTFAVDVKAATESASAFRANGIAAEVITADTPMLLRASILRKFKDRQVLQLVNVDLFGEGFDLPAIEVVSMARPTQSYSLYAQQFGRALRLMEDKEYALIIDHVGNVIRHGLPDAPRIWTLDRRDRKSSTKATVMVKTCPDCTGVYERVRTVCPYCGFKPEPANRSSIEAVDGDLFELDSLTLAKLRGQIDLPVKIPFGATPEVVGALKKHHRERSEAQSKLRLIMSQWGGEWVSRGDTLAEAQRRFYITYGIDVATAQTLGKKDTLELIKRIQDARN